MTKIKHWSRMCVWEREIERERKRERERWIEGWESDWESSSEHDVEHLKGVDQDSFFCQVFFAVLDLNPIKRWNFGQDCHACCQSGNYKRKIWWVLNFEQFCALTEVMLILFIVQKHWWGNLRLTFYLTTVVTLTQSDVNIMLDRSRLSSGTN